MRDSRGRAVSPVESAAEAVEPGAEGVSAGDGVGVDGEADPEDMLGLLTAGDSAGDPPSVGVEELTHDLSRELCAPNQNHTDTVRLERAAAKDLPRTNGSCPHMRSFNSTAAIPDRPRASLPTAYPRQPKKALTVRGLR
jgi:hypothetical protein